MENNEITLIEQQRTELLAEFKNAEQLRKEIKASIKFLHSELDRQKVALQKMAKDSQAAVDKFINLGDKLRELKK